MLTALLVHPQNITDSCCLYIIVTTQRGSLIIGGRCISVVFVIGTSPAFFVLPAHFVDGGADGLFVRDSLLCASFKKINVLN